MRMKPKPPRGLGSIGPDSKSGKSGQCLCGGRLKYEGSAGEEHFRWQCKKCKKDIIADKDGVVLLDPYTGEVVDFLSEQDKQYFESHPNEEYYDRAAHPSEFPKEAKVPVNSNVYVRVFNVIPGLRMRTPWILAAGIAKGNILGIPTKVEEIFPQAKEIREKYYNNIMIKKESQTKE